jgi:ankyrin repeat protein
LFLWFGADPNLRKQHDPLLVVALRTADLGTARLLLDHGADPNGQTSEFMARTPALSVAVATGRTELIELLLDRGADPDLGNNWGETALGRAARTGKAPAAQLLLSRGANPNHVDRYGRRPIDVAREAHDSNLERILGR